MQDIRNFPKYFTSNMIAGAGKVSNMYRPVLTLSFAIDYFLWQGIPFGFHLTSIILHAANSILIFFLIYKLFKNRFVSFLAAIFFIVHPIQSEAIAYASGRTDPLYTFFALIALLLSASLIQQNKTNILKYAATIFLFILSLLSKETAIILPILLLLIILTQKDNKKIYFRRIFFFLLPFFLIDAVYIFLRLTVLNFANTLNFYQIDNPYSTNLWVRLFTFTRVFFEYLSVIIFPKNLIFARDIQYITNAFNPWVFASLIISIVLFSLSIKFFNKNKLFFFSFSWFFITIAPVSGIIPINSIITEHYLYLSSISFFIIFAYVFSKLMNLSNLAIKFFSIVLFLLIIIVFSIRTTIRNFDWKDGITFYTASLKQSPWHIPMRHNLAMTLADKGEYDVAINEYKTLISLSDVYPQVHHNLANAYQKLGKYKEAEKEYLTAIKMDPNFYFSYYALVDLYQKTGEKEKLKQILELIGRIRN
ncbi:tetratricopeptide repeat protein [Candidatus Gottesmanbacteria bacterium]|nr:tetratricopeptide repeat protein [Candidatus Gottesmanbacteria bacterium]